MKESRVARAGRDRKAHLSADGERLVAAALGLAHSGSRIEDRFWEQQLVERVARLLDSGHALSIQAALDRLDQTDSEAYGALIEAVETAAESMTLEQEGEPFEVLLITAPVVAWTRFRIPSGPISTEAADALAAHWQAHVLARDVRFRMVPALYSVDQLPRDFAELRRLTRRLGQAALSTTAGVPRNETRNLPETAEMLADGRFLVGVVVARPGAPLFRWQEMEPGDHASRIQSLEQWIAQARPWIEPMLPGCGFECLLPDGYHINLRETDRRIRGWAVKASVHFLTHALDVHPETIRATVAAFGTERADEYRIGLSIAEGEEVAHGVVWPLFGPESENEEPVPIEQIRLTLREAGVTEMRVWPELIEPEYCEDCGVPLFPSPNGEVVHAEMPEDASPEGGHFH